MKAPHSKCGIGASLSGVRIPPSPPCASIKHLNCFVFITASNLQSYNWSYFPTGLEADCRGQWRTTGAFRQPLTPVMTFTTVAPPLAPSPSPLTGCGDFPYARSRISLIAAILTCSLCACLAKRTNSAKASGAYRSATALISTVVLFSLASHSAGRQAFGSHGRFPPSTFFSSHFAPWFILVF